MSSKTDYIIACRRVLDHCPNPYAKAYASAGLMLYDHEIPAQCLYILSNLGNWRGEMAKECRATFRRYAPPPRLR